MTILEVYDNVLTELNKVEAPTLLIQDFNYFLKKAVYQKINKDYNFFDINQQHSDSLKGLTVTKELPLTNNTATLPSDYIHMLSCMVVFNNSSDDPCNGKIYKNMGAIRLTVDSKHQVENNYYMKPSYKRPYYMISSDSVQILSGQVTPSSIVITYLKEPVIAQLGFDFENGETILEFSEYVCLEIVNELVKLILENGSDSRLQTHIPINQSIASPAQGGK